MLKALFIITIFFNYISADTQEELLVSIKLLIEQNGKKIEQNGQKIEQNGEQIKQNSAYIKTMQSQISFTQTLLTVILGGVIASPLVIIYFQRKDDKYAKKEIKDSIERTRNIVTALKELSEDDPKIQRSLRVAGIY